jgi:hypothetical protein
MTKEILAMGRDDDQSTALSMVATYVDDPALKLIIERRGRLVQEEH